MASRLDRLFILLETGSSGATRRTAAAQLGSVTRSYPDQLPQLLSRVGELLRAPSWETRIAAGAAVRALLEHHAPQVKKEDVEEPPPSPPPLIDLLPQLLNPDPSSLLMAAEGAAFDRVSEVDDKKARELLKKQIYGPVGALLGDTSVDDAVFGGEGGEGGGVGVNGSSSHPPPGTPDTQSQQQLSSRQLNAAKRRAKQRAAPSTASNANSAAEKRPKRTPRQVGNVTEFTAGLLEDLYAVDWETRHGAATGLREVIIATGATGGGGPSASASTLLPHLVRILALDRFSDFVSDQLVAPVRETAGQALGALLPHLDHPQVEELDLLLVRLLEATAWETRHGALIGLKYLLTLRGEGGRSPGALLRSSFGPVLKSLSGDENDDVSAAAAGVLQPIVPALIAQVEAPRLEELISALYSALKTLDDLSAASCSVMELLAALLEERRRAGVTCVGGEVDIKVNINVNVKTDQPHPHQNGETPAHAAAPLLTLLLPFLHHKSTSVRRCALQSLLSTTCPPEYLPLALRHLYERSLLETVQEELHPLIQAAWTHFVEPPGAGVALTPPAPTHVTALEAATRELLPLWLWLAMLNPRVPISHDPAWLLSPPAAEKTFIGSGVADPTGAKVAATRLTLARMIAALGPEQVLLTSLEPYLASTSGLQRTVAALVIWFWGEGDNIKKEEGEGVAPSEYVQRLASLLEQNLSAAVAYEETASTFTRLQTEARDFLSTLRHYGVNVNVTGVDCSGSGGGQGQGSSPSQWLSLDQMGYLSGEEVKGLIASLRTRKTMEVLEERRKGLLCSREEAVKEWRDVNLGTLAATASALIALPLPLPQKLSPVIKPLIDALRSEANASLQRHAAAAVVRLLAKATPKANTKVLQNLIQSLNANTKTDDVRDEGGAGATPAPLKSIEVRGAEMALQAICRGADVEGCGLWDLTVGQLLDGGSSPPPPTLLPTLNFILPHLPRPLHSKLPALLPRLLGVLPHSARTLAVLCQLLPSVVMAPVVEALLGKLRGGCEEEAEGAVTAVHEVVEALGLAMLPWVVLLVVPVLRLMSSPSPTLRPIASLAFAALIRLLPLESGVPPPPNLPFHLQTLREEQREFLDQLLHPSHITPYEVRAEIHATLRPYQQAGVDWLGFLRRFGLHGILCDDMGLGKTLMCICLLAEEVRRGQEGVGAGASPTPPSLVVCPPTLTGHWVYEIHKFAPSLRPLHYHGAPAERARLQERLPAHNILIASYDIVRNDLDFFSAHTFHYCVLDEGHVIKNGRTKLSKAIKLLRASHRLILTGTPIQNHVLELHSLFDFLMPGFLGSEKVFAARFARPILAARDSKCSDKEAEGGALAMEALHRQALPFLLRRLKEDVLQDLPPKITQDYFCVLSPLQALLYEDFAKTRAGRSLTTGVGGVGGGGGHARPPSEHDFTHIFQSLQYLRKVCNHPKLVLQGHPKAAEIVGGLKQGEIDQVAQSGKLGALKQLLTSLGIFTPGDCSPGPSPHRALIFCQLKSMLDIVESDLLRAHMPGVTYLRLDGSVPAGQRQSLVQRFNGDVGIDLLLLTTQVGGLGLNLTGADTVIFVEHDWNPMRDLQAMDRAHRIGQTRTVNVYRLITRGTLEEKIMGLQKFKLLTAQTVIGGENKQLETMRTDQLLDLFTLDSSGGTTCSRREHGDKDAAGAGADGLLGAYRHVIEAVPELWDEKLYDDEYDLSTFIKSLN